MESKIHVPATMIFVPMTICSSYKIPLDKIDDRI
jgi:hypothetical protein